MRGSEIFPSNYVKADDLPETGVRVVMANVEMEKIGDDEKPVLYFHGKEKGLVLNKTNWNNIAFIHGDESDEWEGKPIIIFPTTTDFQGRTVACIRVREDKSKKAAPKHSASAGKRTQAQEPPPNTGQVGEGYAGHLDDEIPFAPHWK